MEVEEAKYYHKIDTVIVGAGLAGLRAALEISKNGQEVAIVVLPGILFLKKSMLKRIKKDFYQKVLIQFACN